MVMKLGKFEMPRRLLRDEKTATDKFSVFIAEPFEAGYGHTLGNSLRRILLSSIEGAAITSVKIEGVLHEFSTVDGVVEEVTQIILNLKKVLLEAHTREVRKLEIHVDRKGEVTAADIITDNTMVVLNPDLHIATLSKKVKLDMEMEARMGRGYSPAEKNKMPDQPIGVIPIDAIFTPVRRVNYHVENTRVGHRTDFDRLVIEIWTDGRISPDDAIKHAAVILDKHLNVFVDYDKDMIEIEEEQEEQPEDDRKLEKILELSINEIELSVRSANCITSANIKTIGDLVSKNEAEMLKYRNFGKKSLNEIKEILTGMGLSLGMQLPVKALPGEDRE
ncbi:MAG: DNA-directed RNA polymerase subunit alpha [Candidatus Tritonobacter lacicola]|nr:DNA-directed RNA polymerase subunit alpha [Candidatus Tritonobacter lacicola]